MFKNYVIQKSTPKQTTLADFTLANAQYIQRWRSVTLTALKRLKRLRVDNKSNKTNPCQEIQEADKVTLLFLKFHNPLEIILKEQKL